MKQALLIRRFLSVVADVSIAITLFFYLFSFTRFEQLFSQYNSWIVEFLPPNSVGGPIIVTCLWVYFININLKFFETIILGQSVGQLVCGIFGSGNFVWRRIGGGARVMFELVLSPFIVFDLPVLIKRRSLKELLTFTTLNRIDGMFFYFVGLVVTPVLLFISLISPLFQNLSLIDGVRVSFDDVKRESIQEKVDFTSFRNYQSNTFNLSFFSSLADGRYKLIPSFLMKKNSGVIESSPYLDIYDLKQNTYLRLKKIKTISLFDYLNNGKSFNPLFFARYPELAIQLAKDRKIFERRDYRPSFGNKLILNHDVREEIKELLVSSFELSLARIFDHVMLHGPFIKGHVDVRNSILQLFDFEVAPVVSMSQYGDNNFLIFTEDFSEGEVKRIVQKFVGIESNSATVFQLEVSGKGDLNSILVDFKRYLLSSSNWYFDYNAVFPFPISKSELSPFSILDFIFDEMLVAEKRKLIEDFTYHYFFDLAVMALNSKNDEFIEVVANAVNNHFLMGKVKWKHKVVTEDFIGHMKTLAVALKNRDRIFFGL